jgi:hypothetical protein
MPPLEKRPSGPLPLCGATTRQGGRCNLVAGKGTSHLYWGNCLHHGGCTKNGVAFAARLKAEAEMAKADAANGNTVEVDPIDALVAEVRRAAGHVEWLGRLIAQSDPDALTDNRAAGTELSVWLRKYQAERQLLVQVAESAIRTGVDERRVRIAQKEAQLIAGVFEKVMADEQLGLSYTQREVFRVVAARHLRALATQGEPDPSSLANPSST